MTSSAIVIVFTGMIAIIITVTIAQPYPLLSVLHLHLPTKGTIFYMLYKKTIIMSVTWVVWIILSTANKLKKIVTLHW